MAYQAPAPTGLYLSSFLENYLRSRGLQEAQRQAESRDILGALQGRQLLEEAQVGPDIADLIARGRQPATIPGAGLAPAGAPPLAAAALPPTPAPTPGNLGQVAIPEGLQVPQPGGGVGTLIPSAARPSPFEAVTGGLPPAAVARLLTTTRGQGALKTVEQAERDRREQEDLKAAEGLMEEGSQAFKDGDSMKLADRMAAGLRRLKQYGAANTWQMYAVTLREKKDERQKGDAYAKQVFAAYQKSESTPSPENLQSFWDAVADTGDSTIAQAIAQDRLNNLITKRLDVDPQKHFFYAEIVKGISTAMQDNKVPDMPAIWKGAIVAQPAGFERLLSEYVANPKQANLPDFVLELARLTPLPVDLKEHVRRAATETLTARGLRPGMPGYSQAMIQEIGRLTELGETPSKAKAEQLLVEAREYAKGVREGTVAPDLDKITLMVQRLGSSIGLNGALAGTEYEEGVRESMGILSEMAKAGVKKMPGQPVPAAPKPVATRQPGKPLTTQQKALKARRDALVAGNFPGKTWATLSPEEKQTISDLIDSQMTE